MGTGIAVQFISISVTIPLGHIIIGDRRGKLTLQIIDPHGNLLQIIFTNAIQRMVDFSKLWCFVSDYRMLCHIRRRQFYIKQMRMNILLVCVFVLLFSFWMVPMETIKVHINRLYCIYECVFDYARIRLL